MLITAREAEEGFTEEVTSVESRKMVGRLKSRRRCWDRGSTGV